MNVIQRYISENNVIEILEDGASYFITDTAAGWLNEFIALKTDISVDEIQECISENMDLHGETFMPCKHISDPNLGSGWLAA